MVGYIQGATNGNDRLYDAALNEKTNFTIYSLIDKEKMIIQGKALPFDSNDTIPIGYSTPVAGDFKIAIGQVDGVFSNNDIDIFLEDKMIMTTHNLRLNPYIFSSVAGVIEDRFVLKFKDKTLSSPVLDYQTIKVTSNHNTIAIISQVHLLKNIVLYDVLGKTIFTKNKVNSNNVTINEIEPLKKVYIVKITLEDDRVLFKKIIF